jgi:O-antigen/teichoic acid export membrane protein
LSLANKSVKGTVWTLLDIVLNKAIYFIATLILAGLLGPVEFGLIGMIMIFFTIGTTLVDSGLSVSLIRTSDPDDLEYSTIFYMNMGMSFVAYILIFAIAPLVAFFYSQPLLEPLIRVYCIGFIITALRIIPQCILVRDMNFKKIAILNFPGNIIGLIVGVWMAKNNYNVWSIVGLFLTTQLISTIMYLMFSSWKPKMKFSIPVMTKHWNFGFKLMLSAQLNTLFENIYNILIGKIYNVKSLGYYERAYTLNNYPISIISLIVSKVSLPLFSSIAYDESKLTSIYRKVMLMSFYISAPTMLGALVVAKPLLLTFLGSKWMPAVPFFQILCLANMLYPIHSLSVNILSVYGRSDLFFKLELVKKAILVLFVLVCMNFGIIGLVWSSVLSSIASLFLNIYYCGRLINYSTKEQLLDLSPTLIISIFMAFLIFVISNFIQDYHYLFQLVVQVISGIIIYTCISFVTKNESFIQLFNLIKKYDFK